MLAFPNLSALTAALKGGGWTWWEDSEKIKCHNSIKML